MSLPVIKGILSNAVMRDPDLANKKLHTLSTDTIDDGTIVYDMNEHGYRSHPFSSRKDVNILCLGCSWTVGLGVRNELIWPTQLSQLISPGCAVFNYGYPGASVSFVAKNFYKIVTTEIVPDIALIMWPGFSRRDYINETGEFRRIGGVRLADSNDLVWRNESEDLLFIQLRNDYQDMMVFWEAYKYVEVVAKLYGIKVYHTVAGYYYDVFKKIRPNLDETIDRATFFDPEDCYKNDMLARDKQHPSEKWHTNFSLKWFNHINQMR